MQVIKELTEILVPTKDFPDFNSRFDFFNRLQSTFLSLNYSESNTIVAATTSAGKTVCAELAIRDCLLKNKKCVVLSPLKALSNQQYKSWTNENHFLSKYNIEILTGDHKLTPSKVENLNKANIILMTSEMLDTRTRFSKSSSSAWINDVDLLVVDEAHLLTTKRGPALEVGLMRFSQLNKSARIMLLSATMTNAETELNHWLKNLNNKETITLSSKWRPVDISTYELEPAASTQEFVTRLIQILTCNSKYLPLYLTSKDHYDRTIAESRAKNNPDETKTLVFVHTKNDGVSLQNALEAVDIQAAFHNADLTKKSKDLIEEAFKNKLDVLIATSTLAWGINLPAKNVVILGDYRGGTKVDPIDIVQMAGRAGRLGMYERGCVYLVNTKLENNFIINSQLDNHLRFHFIAEIHDGLITNTEEAINWYSKSFAFFQKSNTHPKEAITRLINAQIRALLEKQLIKQVDNKLSVTPLGKIARDLYLDPFNIASWYNNFNSIQNLDWSSNPAAVAWAIGNNIHDTAEYMPASVSTVNRAIRTTLKSLGWTQVLNMNLSLISAITYTRLVPQQANFFKQIPINLVQIATKDYGRTINALKRIADLCEWNRSADLDSLYARVVYGVDEHLVELVKIPGVGAAIATQLYRAGIKNKEQLILNKNLLSDIITHKANVTKILKALAQEQEKAEEDIDFE